MAPPLLIPYPSAVADLAPEKAVAVPNVKPALLAALYT